MKSKHSKEKKKSEIILIVFRIIFIIIIIYCSIKIFLWYRENKKNENMLSNINNSAILDTAEIEIPVDSAENPEETTKIETYSLDFNNLSSINSSTVGWINVPGTSINYPVTQASDNNFYLSHTFDKSYNSAGWIFADFRNKFDGTDKNIIIYGHNRKDSSMFATLKNTQTQEWFENKNNHYITFTTPTETQVYEVFSVYKIKTESYYITTSFTNDNSYSEFLNTLKGRSIYNFGTNLTSDDKILTLSSCDSSGKYRIVVHAKKIM